MQTMCGLMASVSFAVCSLEPKMSCRCPGCCSGGVLEEWRDVLHETQLRELLSIAVEAADPEVRWKDADNAIRLAVSIPQRKR